MSMRVCKAALHVGITRHVLHPQCVRQGRVTDSSKYGTSIVMNFNGLDLRTINTVIIFTTPSKEEAGRQARGA